ncbi:hypothetical protein [Paraburkholderia panacisoli]
MDGCSDLLVDIFGERGRHVRTCVGVSALPLNGVIVVEAVFEIEPGCNSNRETCDTNVVTCVFERCLSTIDCRCDERGCLRCDEHRARPYG